MGLCPAPTWHSLRSALSSCTSGHMCLTAMALHPWGHRELQMPQIRVFFYKSPFSMCLRIPSAPGALAVGSSESSCPALEEQVNPIPSPQHCSRSSGQTLAWHSILSANEPQGQMT